MRKIFYLLLLLSTSFFYGQTSGISYQAVIYNPNGQNIPGVNIQNSPMVNRPVCLRFNLIDNLSQLEYQEVIQTTTDEFGMVNLIIGSGNQTGGYSSSFNSVVWNSNTKSLKVEFSTNGDCQQFVILSNNPLSTVPFAYAAVTADNVSGVVAIQNGGTGATNITDAKINLVLNNVDNTSDLNKPISTATQAALDTKENTIAAGTTAQYFRGDKTWQTLDKSAVGLSNVDNTSDSNKPISTATQTALDAKENLANKSTTTTLGTSNTLYPTQNAVKTYVDTQIASATIPDATTLVKGKIQLAGDLGGTAASPTVPGLANKENNILPGTTAQYYRGDKTWQTLDKTTVGLANVDNTSDANKPISTATQAALNTKENTANKSISVPLDGTSNIKFPSVKAVKDYVDGAIAIATIPDATTAIKGKIQLAGDLGGTAAVPTVPGLANKENTANKSTTTTLGTSDVLYPSQNAVKTYVDNNITTVNNANSALQATVNANATAASNAIAAVQADVNQNEITSNAADVALQNNITTLQNTVTTNAANTSTALALKENTANKSTTTTLGTSDVLFPSQNAVKTYVDTQIASATIPDATTAIKGKIQLAGDLGGTAAVPTVPGLANKENTANKSTTTTLGTSDVLFPSQNAVKTYVDTNITTVNTATSALQATVNANATAASNATAVVQADVDANETAANTAINLKENTANKSTTTTLGTSDVLFPSQNAVKTYVDTNITTVNTATSALQATVNANATAASNATALVQADVDANETAANTAINLKENLTNKSTTTSLGTSDVLYPTQNAVKTYVDAQIATATIVDADTTTKGKIQLAGDLGGTAAAPTVPGLANKEDLVNKSLDVSTDGTSDEKYPSVKAVKDYVDSSISSGTIPDATNSLKGKIQLAGDITGSAASPTVANGAITTSKLADNAVTSSKIVNGTIVTSDLADDAVTSAKIVDGTIVTIDLADDAVTSGKIVDGTVVTIDLADDAVTSGKIVDGTIVTIDLADDAVTSAKIVDGTVDTIDLADDAVETIKIKDANVTTAKIANTSVTNAKLDKANIPLSGFAAAAADVDFGSNKLTNVTDPTTAQDAATKNYVDTTTSAITTLADGKIYLGNASNVATEVAPTGDVTITNAGVTAIGTSKVVTTMIANDAVETIKIKDANVTTAKIANTSVTNAKLDKANIPLSGFAAAAADVDFGSNKLTNVTDPTTAQDAATKNYVDTTTSAITTLADGKIYLGNASNVATEVAPTGDVTITNAGVTAIGTSKVVTTMIADDAVETIKIKDANVTTAKIANTSVTNAKLDKANIPLSGFGAAAADVDFGSNKLTNVTDPTTAQDAATKNYVDTTTSAITTLADGKIYLGNASNVATEVAPTGDVTITNVGVTAIGASKVVTTMIADNAVETAKIKDANVTYAKIQNVSATDKVLGRVSTGAGVIEEIATTGSGAVVRATSPTLVTPDLGVPSAVDLTNATGLPLTSGVIGTLPVSNGGTGLTSLTAGYIPFGNGTNALESSSKLFWDNTNENLGIGTSAPNSTAILDLSSTSKALLVPRMTNAQRNALSNPLAGSVIYNTTNGTAEFLASSTSNNITGESNLNNGGNAPVAPLSNMMGMPMNAINEAQSFTPSMSANLTSITINAGNIDSPGTYTLKLYDGDGVSGTLLGSQTVTINSAGINTFNLTTPIALTSGQTYTFEFVSITGGFRWNMSPDLYAGGMAYQNTSSMSPNDFYFSTTYSTQTMSWSALSGSNTGDNSTNSLYSGLVTNATHTGDVTGSTVLTIGTAKVTNTMLAGSIDLTTKVTGTLPVANGGTGTTTATGTGNVVLPNTPTLVTPVIGAATGTSLSVSGQLTSTVAIGTAPLVVTSTTPVANLSIGGNAATVTTNANLTGDVTSVGNATTVGKINGTALSGLATGILKNTTSTGVPSIAVAADFPTLNQNTTGTAANVTGTVAIANGGTGATTAAAALANLVGNPSPNTVLAGLAAGVNTIVNSDGSALTGWSNTGNLPVLDNTISAASFKFGPSNNWDMERDLGQSLMGKSYQFDIYFTANSNNAFLFGHNSSGSNGRGIYLSQVGTSNGFISGTNSFLYTNKDGADTNTFSANTWYTIKVSLATGTNASSYSINGVLKSTFTWTDSGNTWFGFVSDGGISYIDNINVTSVNTGSPSFRSLVAADIPTLNQNTTGTAANVTGTVAIANGGTGSTTQNFVDLTTTQTIAGTKTFSSTIAGSITGNAATVTTNANLTGPITSSGNATSIASQTGTGTKFVMDTSPTLVTPVIGAATGTSLSVSGQLTSTVAIGTAPLVVTSTTPVANLNIGGNAATATTSTNIAGGAAGSLPYQTAAATTAMLAKGADGQILTLVSGSPSWSNAAGSTVVTSSTTYAITLADAYVFYTGTAAGALTIPAAASTNAGKAIIIKNKTAFGITITPATTGNIYIDNANTAVNTVTIGIEASNNWIKLVSDGTQWNVFRALF